MALLMVEGSFYWGISENHVALTWFFAWLNVVRCVVNVVFLQHTLWLRKIRQVFGIYFGLGGRDGEMRGA